MTTNECLGTQTELARFIGLSGRSWLFLSGHGTTYFFVCESENAEAIVNRTMCQKNLRDERQRVQMVIEAMPRKLAAAKEAQEAEAKAKAGGSVGNQQVSGKESCH